MASLNKNHSAVKRIMQEAKELANDSSTDYTGAPLEDDIFEWHCTLRGPPGTDFEGGLYHFRILLPAEYPFRPPAIMILTPNGRFELNTKICISFTNYHEDLWQPAWGVRTAIIGLQGFFPLKGQAAVGVGAVEYPPSERRRLAALSREWICPHCKESNLSLLPDLPTQSSGDSGSQGHKLGGSVEPDPIEPGETRTVVTPVPEGTTVDTVTEVDEHCDSEESQHPSLTSATTPALSSTSSSSQLNTVAAPVPRPVAAHHQSNVPWLLDTTICVLLVLVFALVCRRFL